MRAEAQRLNRIRKSRLGAASRHSDEETRRDLVLAPVPVAGLAVGAEVVAGRAGAPSGRRAVGASGQREGHRDGDDGANESWDRISPDAEAPPSAKATPR